MVAKAYPAERIRRVLSRIGPIGPEAAAFTMSERAGPVTTATTGVGLVLSRQYVVGSVMDRTV